MLGIGLLGLAQLIGVAAIAFAAAVASDAIDAPAGALATIAIVLGSSSSATRSMPVSSPPPPRRSHVRRSLQNATTPLMVVMVASLILSIATLNDPEGTLAKVFSMVPPFSAIVMPPRVAAGDASAWQIVAAVGLLLAAVGVLVPIAGRIYSSAVLRTRGRVRLRDAWGAGA